MQQHPVPQPISSYEFKLIGNMTLKQFAKLTACCLVALVFYGLGLPGFIKVPAVVFFVSLGAGLAFLPINERPLDIWIISFFKAVFSPTQYVWKKDASIYPDNLNISFSEAKKNTSVPATPAQTKSSVIFQAQSTMAQAAAREDEFLRKMQSLFASGPIVKSKIETKFPPSTNKIGEAIAPVAAKDKVSPLFVSLPNIISGVVKDKEGKITDGVILEIKDAHGLAVRALRSNKLGQFRIATPLPNGTYTLIPEKDGLSFDIIKIELKGGVFTPIEISAK